MGITSEMKELTSNIASSRRERASKLDEIRQETKQARGETKNLIENFQASRKELKSELKEASVAWQELASAKAKNEGGRTKKWESQQE